MQSTIVCDICHVQTDRWIDGKTYIRMGVWANMCGNCFTVYGVGLGSGKGQEYHKGIKIAG